MGYQELISSLRKEGEDKARSIRAAAEAEAEMIRSEAAERTARLREDFRSREEKLIKDQGEEIRSSARFRARAIKLSAEKSLSDRLYTLASSCLHELRGEGYETIFASLIKELPSSEWDEVRVNPQDLSLAGQYFPNSGVAGDDRISGGLEVFSADGKRHIINTFEKRLERAWEHMLTGIVRDIYREEGVHGISQGD